jgi:hypothetical protein
LDKQQALAEIDQAIVRFNVLRSRYGQPLNDPLCPYDYGVYAPVDEATKLITLLHSTIERIIPPDTAFSQQLAAVPKGSSFRSEALKMLFGILEAVRDAYFNDRIQVLRPSSDIPAFLRLERLLNRVHKVARQLLERRENRSTLAIEDEYDAQDLLHALLKIDFDDIRPEEWTPKYAGGATRMDFLLKKEQIVVEVKKTRDGLDATRLGEELLIDIAKYKMHPDCKTLVCFVYDPEQRLSNPEGLRVDLENETSERLSVKVVICQS